MYRENETARWRRQRQRNGATNYLTALLEMGGASGWPDLIAAAIAREEREDEETMRRIRAERTRLRNLFCCFSSTSSR